MKNSSKTFLNFRQNPFAFTQHNNIRFTTVYVKVTEMSIPQTCIRRAQVKVGLINLCKGLFSLNALIYYKFKSGT
jgi:hypothetical protein